MVTYLIFTDDGVVFTMSLKVLVMVFDTLHEEVQPLESGFQVSRAQIKPQVFGGLLGKTEQFVYAIGEDIDVLENWT